MGIEDESYVVVCVDLDYQEQVSSLRVENGRGGL